MTANKERKTIRHAKVLEAKTAGKSFNDIAKTTGTSKATAWRDWQELKQDETIIQEIENLKKINLANALNSAIVEGKWVKTHETGEFGHDVAGKINSIKNSSIKIYSGLEGQGTDKKGGEIINEEKQNLIKGLLEKL